MVGRLPTLALVILGSRPPTALADERPALAHDATFGNEAGCAYVRDGQSHSDDLSVLRPTQIQQYESACEFVDVRRDSNGAYAVRSICLGEGSYWLEDMVIVPGWDDPQSLVAYFQSDRAAIPVRACP